MNNIKVGFEHVLQGERSGFWSNSISQISNTLEEPGVKHARGLAQGCIYRMMHIKEECI